MQQPFISGLVALGVVFAARHAVNAALSYTVLRSPRGDGDTIRAKRWLKTESIRLAHIDAPEKGQEGGAESAAVLAALLPPGTRVRLSETSRDKYGRLCAVITRRDGLVVNKAMVTTGWAWWYEEYSYDESYGVAMETARDEKLGMWKRGGNERPSDWRKKNK